MDEFEVVEKPGARSEYGKWTRLMRVLLDTGKAVRLQGVTLQYVRSRLQRNAQYAGMLVKGHREGADLIVWLEPRPERIGPWPKT